MWKFIIFLAVFYLIEIFNKNRGQTSSSGSSWLSGPLLSTMTPTTRTTKVYSANIVSNLHAPAQPVFSANLAHLGNIEEKRFNELEFRLNQLEDLEVQKNIMGAFGSVRTTGATTTTMTVPTTKRSLTLCEKRSIAENKLCKSKACFRSVSNICKNWTMTIRHQKFAQFIA